MKLRLLLTSFFFSTISMAQVFTSIYDFAGVTNGVSGTTDPTTVPVAAGVNFGSFMAVGTPAQPGASGRFSFNTWPLGATNGSNTFTGNLDLGKYYQVTIGPQNNFSLNLYSIAFTLQRSATGIRQYAIRSSADGYTANLPASINPANTLLQALANNVFQVDDAATTAMDGSTITLVGFTNFTAPVTFRLYGWNAESNAGTFSIDNVAISGEALPLMGAPVISLNKGSVLFPSTAVNATATVQSYTVNAVNLMANLSITTTAPYSISSDNIAFGNTLFFSPAQVASPQTVYIKFTPTTTGSFAANITHNSAGATQKIIALNGEGVNPSNFDFNFNTCTNLSVPGTGFISYSVTGAQLWVCTSFGRNFTNGVNVNGFLGSALDNEDWLISPSLNLSSFTNLPVLNFYSRAEFSGLPLELLVSTNYDGYSNPNTATWATINADFPAVGTNVWTGSDNINLDAYKGFANVYIAFKYLSSPNAGAPRWSLDDINIANRTQLFATSPNTAIIDLGEAASATFSASKPINLQAIGYGDITVTAPAGFQVSANNSVFSTAIVVPVATATAGTTIYVRFSPTSKALKITGQLNFSGTGLNSTRIPLVASSYLKSETLDVVTYNLKFFGSGPTGSAPLAQQDAQKNNIKTVIDRLNADVIGFQEMSNDSLFNKLLEILPGYDKKVSSRWSSSFLPPDPTFPPQKVGFIYKTSTMQFVEERVMFEKLYDDARAGNTSLIPAYPTGSASNFWSSGRLPYMVTMLANINGISRKIRFISIHAKSGSGSSEDYQRRIYDTRVLKDSLDMYYATDSIVLVGDYNDPVIFSEFGTGNPSPYKIFIDDNAKYTGITSPLETANRPTYIGSTNGSTIDHHIISNEMNQSYILNSADIEDPRNYIANYSSSTSDHLPVFSRFDFTNPPLPVTLTKFDGRLVGKDVVLSWGTATEINSSYFLIERSIDGVRFENIGKVLAAGNSNTNLSYGFTDSRTVEGNHFYRLKTVDKDAKFAYSAIVKIAIAFGNPIEIKLFPNPVTTSIQLSMGDANALASWQLLSGDGKVLWQLKGNIPQVNAAINKQLSLLQAGMYWIKAALGNTVHRAKFIKQ